MCGPRLERQTCKCGGDDNVTVKGIQGVITAETGFSSAAALVSQSFEGTRVCSVRSSVLPVIAQPLRNWGQACAQAQGEPELLLPQALGSPCM